MSSVSTRAVYSAQATGISSAAGGLAMPMFDCNTNGTGDFISQLSTLQSSGARAILKFVGASSTHMDSSSSFSLAMWRARMDLAFDKYGSSAASRAHTAAQIHDFFMDGTLVANYMLDDVKDGTNVFAGGTPQYTDFESCASYSKSVWTVVPCCIRVENQYLASKCTVVGASNYTYLDFGWAQWRASWGNALNYYQNHVNSGRTVKLGAFSGINLLAGGSGSDPAYQYHPASSKPALFGMSPSEIAACGDAFEQLPTMIGIDVWSQNPTFDDIDYYHNVGIQTALTDYANKAIGRTAGPFNFRDTTDAGGGTGTVMGNWAVLDTGTVRRSTADSGVITVPALTASADSLNGALIGLLCYSRDSARSATLPSGWSEAARVSGNSARGGDLALFYKVASGAVGNQNVSFPGTSVSNSVMGRMFAISGNTNVMSAVLGVVGSDSSWGKGSSNMGPITGLTSTTSDCLVLICAAKTNDFANGDPTPTTTMSATTGESWNRLFLQTNGLGDESGMFIDYFASSGKPTISSKSWSQDTGAGSSSSGAGCGFMVAFKPTLVTVGTGPVITTLEDLTISLGSTLSFQLAASGSTPVTWSLTSGPSNVTLNTSLGSFQWTPLAATEYYLIVGASNAYGTDSQDFHATVASVASGGGTTNVPPVITEPGNKTVPAQDRLSFVISSIDSDGDTVTYGLENAPAGALIVEDSGHFTWTPTGEQGPGTYGIVVVASDGQNESRSTFTVTVADTPWTRLSGSGPQFSASNALGNQFRRI